MFIHGLADFEVIACHVDLDGRSDEALGRDLRQVKGAMSLDVELPGERPVTVAEDDNVGKRPAMAF